ncbi:hypothetical protein [Thalassospira sp.]|uniref:hypothetical protein n=1 Tax=Thalassospira sp. TaxID=1912094 RepID=UPI0027325883|nr:hypothetical protein [Thalassospira sp.]MDP2697062.1 hypothetical protein [Thalassospira sp.]
MTEDGKQETPTLEGEAALDLWRKGRDVWNRWIDQHPGWNISFDGVDFSTERNSEGKLFFAGYHFGDGDVNFSGTTFGNGTVNFSGATFGDGDVNFRHASFGKGNLIFSNANFGNGDVNFSFATFEDGNVKFSKATFGDGEVSFKSTNFGNGEVKFDDVTFGDGKLIFNRAKFTDIIFLPHYLGSLSFEAYGISVNNLAIFGFFTSASKLKYFSLEWASFGGPLLLNGTLDIVPDLRSTRYSHQVDLSTLNVKLRRKWHKLSWPPKLSSVAKHPEDAARLRRLKEIAETNKDHQAALRFSADENRARRWLETSWFGSVLDMAFSACSNYGQSILRPFVALFVLAVASMALYKKLAVATFAAWWTGPGWGQSLFLSISNSLPFLPQSRSLREGALKALYPGDPGFCVDVLMIGQGVLSFVFLFLIGLGLRNRFRL